jgi:serine/threonine protein kinase
MTSASLYCPKCGGKNEPGAETCFACGESLQAAAAQTPGVTRTLQALIKGRYRIVKRLGSGGFGAVYQAEDVDLGNRLVAVKEVRSGGALATQELQEATEAFHREALLLAGLNHPSLPRIHDHFNEGDHWYLVMEFINGETLERRLERSPNKHVSVKEALQISIKLCEVLEYLHTRQPPIIFRDLKPGNVMITPDDNIYLIDFGIARLFKPGQTKDTMAFGSPGYAAPEQYGKAQTTPRSDVFSLGALLHHMLTGNDPSDTPFRFAPLTMPRPSGLGTFIGQMVSLDEYKRPPSMSMVKRELERLAAAWAERQRGQTTTTAFPTYQAATGYLPAVPRYPPGVAPTQAGPHWMPPPHATGTIYPAPPTQAQPSAWGQSTGMMRTIGPPVPYPSPAMVPMTGPAPARKRWPAWVLPVVIVSIVVLLFVIGAVVVALLSPGAPPAPPYPTFINAGLYTSRSVAGG